jgi:hypothetical protein
MKTISLIFIAAALAAPLCAQSRGGDTQLSSGAVLAYGPAIVTNGLNATAVWNSDETVLSSYSTDGGRSWSATPVVIGGGTLSGAKRTYKDAIASHLNDTYVMYEDKATGAEEHMFTMSSDSGATWSTPTIVPSVGSGYITDINVHANGSVIVATSLALSFPNGCFVNVSNDGGLSWTETRADAAIGDVDAVSSSMSGGTLLVTWVDDSAGVNETFGMVSSDNGATFGSIITLSDTLDNFKTSSVDCWVDNGEMAVAWLEDDSTLSGTFDNLIVVYSADNGATWSTPVALTDNLDLTGTPVYDADNMEITHSGGITNIVYEYNIAGQDDIYCSSTSDYGVSFADTNLGAGSYPRVTGDSDYVGVAFGLGAYPENPGLAVSRDGGVTFAATFDVSAGGSIGDADYLEIAYSAEYNNFVVLHVEDRTGLNQVYAGGSRAALLESTVDTLAGTLQLNISGISASSGGPTQVQIAGALTSTLGAALLPDGRDVMLSIDPVLLATKSFAPLRVSINAAGNGATGVMTTPASFSGTTILFGGAELVGGGVFGTLIEPIEVIMP